MRVAIYVRVSTQDQSTDLQEQQLLEYASARGWVDGVQIFKDKATGTNMERPELRRMLREARAGRVDLILCWKLDRMFRSMKDMVLTMHELQALGLQFIALKDNIDLTTPAGRLMCNLIGAFAEFEASLIRERVRAGLSAAKQKGVKLGRPTGEAGRSLNYAKIKKLLSSGKSPTEISRDLGIARSTVYRIQKAA